MVFRVATLGKDTFAVLISFLCLQTLQQSWLWKRHRTFWINVGGLTAGAYLLRRTKTMIKSGTVSGGAQPMPAAFTAVES